MAFVRLPDQDIELQDERSNFRIELNRSFRKNLRLSIDIYRFMKAEHPRYHLGWWLFVNPPRSVEALIELDFSKIDENSVRLLIGNELRTADDAWFNREYGFAPIQEVLVLTRNRHNKILENRSIYLKYKEQQVLKDYYEELHSGEGYATENNVFLLTLHKYKLSILKKLFERYFASGSRVLDVGCGNSLFLEIQPDWPFSLYLTDLGESLLRRRKIEEPGHRWAVADCSQIPFQRGAFDGIFAGEIIEHVPSPKDTLRAWNEALRDEGILILTTPNLQRFSNWLSGTQTPISPDHLSEMDSERVHQLLEQTGFEVLDYQGFYLEALGNWLSRSPYRDLLMSSWNQEKFKPLMKFALRLGHVFNKRALGMIFVARKRAGTS